MTDKFRETHRVEVKSGRAEPMTQETFEADAPPGARALVLVQCPDHIGEHVDVAYSLDESVLFIACPHCEAVVATIAVARKRTN
jgi:hypothetical protein